MDLDELERLARASIGYGSAGIGGRELLALVARVRELEAEAAKLREIQWRAHGVVAEAQRLADVLEGDKEPCKECGR